MKRQFTRVAIVAAIACTPVFLTGTLARTDSYSPRPKSVPSPNIGKPVEAEVSPFPEMLHSQLELSNAGLDLHVLELALKGYARLTEMGKVSRDSVIAIADFSKSSKEKRFFVIDLKRQRLVFQTYVAHGRNSGAEFAARFSNKPSSNMSSLGFYVTMGTYMGSNGYSLVLDGCERGINDKARERAIVMHAADYANEEVLSGKGYLGRSFGCPALPEKMNRKVIDRIKGGNVLFIYHPGTGYLENSDLLKG